MCVRNLVDICMSTSGVDLSAMARLKYANPQKHQIAIVRLNKYAPMDRTIR